MARVLTYIGIMLNIHSFPFLVYCYPNNMLKLSCSILAVYAKIAMIFIPRIVWCYVHCLDVVLGLYSWKTS